MRTGHMPLALWTPASTSQTSHIQTSTEVSLCLRHRKCGATNQGQLGPLQANSTKIRMMVSPVTLYRNLLRLNSTHLPGVLNSCSGPGLLEANSSLNLRSSKKVCSLYLLIMSARPLHQRRSIWRFLEFMPERFQFQSPSPGTAQPTSSKF